MQVLGEYTFNFLINRRPEPELFQGFSDPGDGISYRACCLHRPRSE